MSATAAPTRPAPPAGGAGPAAPRPVEPDAPRPAAGTLQPRATLAAALATLGSATILSGVLDGTAWWFWPSVCGVLVAAAGGMLWRAVAGQTRHPRVARSAVLAALPGLLLGSCLITVLSAPSTAVLGVLPGRGTAAKLGDVFSSGLEDVRTLGPPVADHPGLLLMVVSGVLVVAVLVDVLAVSLRRPLAAGLPLLALVAVPAAIAAQGAPTAAFACAASGFLGLLLVCGDGRPPHASSAGGRREVADSGNGATGSGRRIGLVAVLAALLVPALLPGGLTRGWLPRTGDGTGTGGRGGATLVVQPLVTLEQQLQQHETIPLLHVRTNQPEYLRLTALEQYDGSGFRLGRLTAPTSARVTKGLPPTASVASATVRTRVVVEPRLADRYLPVPYQPTAVAVKGDWRVEPSTGTVLSTHTDTSGLDYASTAAVPTPTAATLREQPQMPPGALTPQLRADLQTGRLDPAVQSLLRSVTAGARTPYDEVADVQAFLRGPLFRYDLGSAPAPGPDALRRFLLETRAGYCQQFATSMAVLVRALGLPARVAVGFTQGTLQADGSWLVTNHDAHAWPEVWFAGTGWVRFEPTPRDDSTDAAPGYTTPVPDTGSNGNTPTRLRATGSGATPGNPNLSRLPSDDRAGVQVPSAAPVAPVAAPASLGRLRTAVLAVAAVVLALLLLALALPLTRLVQRRRRLHRSTGPDGPWREALATATDLRLPDDPGLTPRRRAAGWAERLGPGSDGERATLSALVAAEERRRFRAPAGQAGPDGPDHSDVVSLLRAMRCASRPPDRLRARVWPASLVSPLVGWWRRLTTVVPGRTSEPGTGRPSRRRHSWATTRSRLRAHRG